MESIRQFSLTDFLAYFFPGAVGLTGIYLLLLLTPLKTILISIQLNVTYSIILFSVCYVLGVVFSGFSLSIIHLIKKIFNCTDPKEQISDELCGYKDLFLSAVCIVVADKDEKKDYQYCKSDYYLCRFMVFNNMPAIASRYERQNSLKQIRGNMIVPVLICFTTGIAWGIREYANQELFWGSVLIIISVLGTAFSLITLWNKMNDNEKREVKEIQFAFLAGYKSGLIKRYKPNKDRKNETSPNSVIQK